jgi:hypothetical protein
MRIGIEVELGRPRVPNAMRGWKGRMLVLVVVGLVIAVPLAWAAHTFSDVPAANPHHADITVIKNAGITAGCNPPANSLYCPEQAVRRDQMASFLGRGLGRATEASGATTTAIGGNTGNGSSAQVTVAAATISVPGVAGTQFVYVTGTASLFINEGRATACGGISPVCNLYLYLYDGATPIAESFVRLSADYAGAPAAVSAVVAASAGSSKTYTLRAQAFNVNTGKGLVYKPRIVAASFPFGGSGGATIAESGSSDSTPPGPDDITRGSSG